MSEQTSRATRLFAIDRLFRRHPGGLTVRQIADLTGYSARTIQRDLLVLQTENNLPLVDAPGRRYVLLADTAPLGPVRLTLHEARALLLACRLFFRFADERDPDGISALEKIADALPDPVGAQVLATAAQLRTRPRRRDYVDVLRRVTEAWAKSAVLSIRYRSGPNAEIHDTDLEPYLLEPTATGSATYVIGFSHRHGAVRTFKLDRVLQAEVTDRRFDPVDTAAITEKIANSWGVVFNDGDESHDVVLDFTPAVTARVSETTWHPSQRLSPTAGGGVRLELRLPSLLEFAPWVRSWGPEVIVVAPPELRDEIRQSLSRAAARYAG